MQTFPNVAISRQLQCCAHFIKFVNDTLNEIIAFSIKNNNIWFCNQTRNTFFICKFKIFSILLDCMCHCLHSLASRRCRSSRRQARQRVLWMRWRSCVGKVRRICDMLYGCCVVLQVHVASIWMSMFDFAVVSYLIDISACNWSWGTLIQLACSRATPLEGKIMYFQKWFFFVCNMKKLNW